MAAEYHFITSWRLRATAQEVSTVLEDPLDLPRWWPSVYLDVQEIEAGDPVTHSGRVIGLYTKGWLPYTLRWRFTVTESRSPYGFTLDAQGDFVGTGIWTITQDADFVDVRYDWKITVDKALLKYGTFVFRPVFGANHRWAMARGEESLDLELRRRRATNEADRLAVPAPPRPTFVKAR